MLLTSLKKVKKKIKFSIRLTVVSIFIFSTFVTATVAISLQYYFSEKFAIESKVKLFNLTTQNTANYLKQINENAENTIRILSKSQEIIDKQSTDKVALRSLLSQIIETNPLLYALYVGYDNGHFYEVINLNTSQTVRQQYQANVSDRWLVVDIQNKIKKTHYYDENFNLRVTRTETTNYNPKERVWFTQAQVDKVNKTQPYLFSHLQAPGQTYSIRLNNSNTVLAADIPLSNLSDYLIEQNETSLLESEMYIFNQLGELIASNQKNETSRLPELTPLTLNQQQLATLTKYPNIFISNESNWAPIDFSVGGEPHGYGIDLLYAISEMLNLPITFINGFTWSELVEKFDKQEIDMLHSVFYTSTNKNKGLLSEALLELPFSIVTQPNLPIITELSELSNKTLAIPKGWSIIEVVKSKYPEIKIIEVADTRSLLQQVSQGKVDAGLDNEVVLRYMQNQFFIKNIQYHSLSHLSENVLPSSIHLLVQKNQQDLINLLNFAIKQIPANYLAALDDKWLNNGQVKGIKTIGTVPYSELTQLIKQTSNFSQLLEVELNEVEKYVYMMPISINQNKTDYLAITVPKSSVLASSREKIKVSIAITTASLLLILPISWFFATPIVSPIKRLVLENQKIKNRQFSQVTTMESSVIEIQKLATSMVDMSKSIQEHENNQKALMESFIELIAQAIDDKSPYTAGHCERVPELGIMLAKEAALNNNAPFKDFKFNNEDEFREFSLAAWLHDCGKITTPEHIVDKGTKLETIYNRIHEIRMRFEVLWRDAEINYYQNMIQHPERKLALKRKLKRQQSDLIKNFSFIASTNVGGEFMDEKNTQRLEQLAKITWQRNFDDKIGLSPIEELRVSLDEERLPVTEHLLSDKPEHLIQHDKAISYDEKHGIKIQPPAYKYNLGELYNLKIKRGTLTAEDRYKINEHIISTIKMLENVPFPPELSKVPRYASTHHETLIGTGYPRKLSKDDLSVPERVLVLADIFEALTAADRPYKKAKPLSVAIDILAKMVKDQHVDQDVFELFLTSGIYLKYAKKYLSDAQIDKVDITKYLSKA
ncbi:HD domain-containing phosphohydrolase [Catenovulum maritimum]|uniref:Phosphohydrolase n=1 Tax=Catenovulum maritimum TaxID=1513271 RepID=A0A0J8JKT0_9ALTE|nr:HD domain-containing phosphohydrolase [Catenovulum maritimum]KMT65111.1 phosphohydrolase [Catenovulum maritimum]